MAGGAELLELGESCRGGQVGGGQGAGLHCDAGKSLQGSGGGDVRIATFGSA